MRGGWQARSSPFVFTVLLLAVAQWVQAASYTTLLQEMEEYQPPAMITAPMSARPESEAGSIGRPLSTCTVRSEALTFSESSISAPPLTSIVWSLASISSSTSHDDVSN